MKRLESINSRFNLHFKPGHWPETPGLDWPETLGLDWPEAFGLANQPSTLL